MRGTGNCPVATQELDAHGTTACAWGVLLRSLLRLATLDALAASKGAGLGATWTRTRVFRLPFRGMGHEKAFQVAPWLSFVGAVLLMEAHGLGRDRRAVAGSGGGGVN